MKNAETGRFRARDRSGIDEGTGGIRRTVDAIGADAGRHRRCAERREGLRRGERKFLIAPALAVTGHAHRRFSARHGAGWPPDAGHSRRDEP